MQDLDLDDLDHDLSDLCTVVNLSTNPFSTALPTWGQNTWNWSTIFLAVGKGLYHSVLYFWGGCDRTITSRPKQGRRGFDHLPSGVLACIFSCARVLNAIHCMARFPCCLYLQCVALCRSS